MESWGSLAWYFGGKGCPIAQVFHVEHVGDGLEVGATRTRSPLISRGAGGASRDVAACTRRASGRACGAPHEAAATRASTCHATPGSRHHSAVADAARGSPLGGSDGTDANVAERNLVTVPGDRLVEDDPDRRVSLALRASVGFRDMTDERAALGNGSPILGPGGLRGARVDRVSRLA